MAKHKVFISYYHADERDMWGKHIQDEYTDYITPKQNN